VPPLPSRITIGELAARSGVATSALRFYDSIGLIRADRDRAGRRVYPRPALRRVAFIRAGQSVGLSLDEIAQALSSLPVERTPNRADWQRLSSRWRERLDQRIETLEKLRDRLTSCIGCGCLSLRTCALSNPGDSAAATGPGARELR
jgi:MerR family redox-sensitive transcriptional activator SoxR